MVKELEEVVEARRISVRRGDNLIQTNTWVLTFSNPRPPTRIRIEYLELDVRPFVPNPMRCFGCHRYGHTKTHCRRKAACPRCGKEDHLEENCSSTPRCLNCQGEHPAYSKDCPKWKEEKAILLHKATFGGTFAKAKAAVCPKRSGIPALSYAQAVAGPKPKQAGPSGSVSTDDTKTKKKSSSSPKKTKEKKRKRDRQGKYL